MMYSAYKLNKQGDNIQPDVLLSQFGTSLSWLPSKTTKRNSCIYYDISGGGDLVTKSCPTLENPLTAACQAPLSMGFSGQVLKWVAISFSRGSSQLRNQTHISCIADRLSTNWATREALLMDGVVIPSFLTDSRFFQMHFTGSVHLCW